MCVPAQEVSGGTMENKSFKTVAFGGFDKQDVIAYIEQTAREAAEAQKQLQEENETLRKQLAAAESDLISLRSQAEQLSARQAELQKELAGESAARRNLELLKPLEEEAARLREENESLRPDAEAYAQFRHRIGAIECEARKRAADMEEDTAEQMRKTLDLFRQQYQVLMSTFESTASYVTGELRKMEVNLSQLPRAMDQSGSELNELAAVLENFKAN